MRSKSKSIATWVALLAGSWGAHRLYLLGWRDWLWWLHPPLAMMGWFGAWRMSTLGQDDQLASLLVVVLGLMLSQGALHAIVYALTSDARWQQRWNTDQPIQTTRWGPVLGAIAGLMVGGVVLTGTIAFAIQRLFEWQLQAT